MRPHRLKVPVLLALVALAIVWLKSRPSTNAPIVVPSQSPARTPVALPAAKREGRASSPFFPIAETSDGFAPVMNLPKPDPQSHWSNPAKPVEVTFPKNFDAPVRVKCGVANVACTPLNARAGCRGEIAADGSLIYKEAFEGCDVEYRCEAYKTEEFIVVHAVHGARTSCPQGAGNAEVEGSRAEVAARSVAVTQSGSQSLAELREAARRPVPEGRSDNSPAIHCWVPETQEIKSPVGTAEPNARNASAVPPGLTANLSASPSDKSLGYTRDVPPGQTAESAVQSKIQNPKSKMEWSWDLDTHGLTPRLTPASTIELCDEKKVPRLRINAPEGKDANGKPLRAGERLKLSLNGNRVTLAANLEGCAFPVTIDPSWSSTGSMATPRDFPTTTLLKDGRVLVTGNSVGHGFGPIATTSCELYDPGTGTWQSTAPLHNARDGDTATLLNDGTVLVAGGDGTGTSELFDPTTLTWGNPVPMNTNHRVVSAILLNGGQVLVAGSDVSTNYAACELYDPTSQTWSLTGSMSMGRNVYGAVLLNDGTVLVAGGVNVNDGTILSSCEIYNPLSGTWTPTGSMSTPRSRFAITELNNGQILASGGLNGTALSSSEIFNSTSGQWNLSGSLSVGRFLFSSFLLPDGKAIVCGGATSDLVQADTGTTEIFDPASGQWATTSAMMVNARNAFGGALLQNGLYFVVGGDTLSEIPTASCELFNRATAPTILATGSPTIAFEGQEVFYSSITTNPDLVPLALLWDFGDGTTSTDPNPTHSYAVAGTYVASVTITGTSITGFPFSINSNTVTIHVFHDADRPTARFTSSDLNGFVGLPIGFDATFSTDPKNNIVSYDWDFGDGSPHGSGQAIARDYTAEGTYTVTLTITDGDGLTDTTSLTMVILPASEAGLLNSNIKYSVNWNRKATNADTLSLSANINVGSALVTSATPLSLGIVGQTFTGAAGRSVALSASSSGNGMWLCDGAMPLTLPRKAASGPQVKWQVKANTKKGTPKGSYSLKCSIHHASLGQAFALAGVIGSKSATAKIPIKLGIGGSNFSSGIPSSFKFGSNGKASGSGSGPK